MDIAAFFKDFGFPLALCVVLIYGMKAMFKYLIEAHTDRIKKIEAILESQQLKMDSCERDRLKREQENAKDRETLVQQWATASHENRNILRATLEVNRQVIDMLRSRPCISDALEPQSRTTASNRHPSSADLPADPSVPTTARVMKHG